MDARFQSYVLKQPARRATLKRSRLHWIIAIFVLLFQEGAFIMLPTIINEDPKHPLVTPSDESYYSKAKEKEDPEPFETPLVSYGLIIGTLAVTIACIPRTREIVPIISNNKFVFMYLGLLFLSALWSMHPDLTLRRSVNYAGTMAVAVYLIVTFGPDDSIKALSYSLALSAAGSIALVIISPNIGIMQAEGLAGNWRGVFVHKNGLGEAMAIGIFAQLYLLSSRIGSTIWNFFWLSVFSSLLILAKSGTQWVVSSLYFTSFFLYIAWLQHKLLGYAFACLTAFILVAVGVALAVDPGSVLDLLGKDPTLTGRTDIWAVVLQLIAQKPLLGWGYNAILTGGDSIDYWIADQLGDKLPHAHNAWLQVTLQVGLVGLFLILVVVATALWRGLRCCLTGVRPLGFFSLMYFIGISLNSFSESVIGSHQTPGWLVFIMLTFACGRGYPKRKASG
jgi:exopolysaccharide production protein ExoQ